VDQWKIFPWGEFPPQTVHCSPQGFPKVFPPGKRADALDGKKLSTDLEETLFTWFFVYLIWLLTPFCLAKSTMKKERFLLPAKNHF
jgi:hypothetical protein